ncbi:glycerol kinase [Nitrosomonas aestuarii]|uniref:Glycerol kinase n=1 Tax=Nitrosomonas aestuarii TaxID=52441 RepID=A0A1I4A458_9PROT|nr:glycerol kinase GlpK [Nitrosomonas aestuarii]SFK50656.1 glycerol kinase [Nitrosomonas aestuarii]
MNLTHNRALLAIDQGTTSTRAILFSVTGKILSIKQKESNLYYPHKGWVEQRPDDLWHDTLSVSRAVITDAQLSGIQVAGIGITNQRETTLIWDRNTGEPVYNAIVWQDRRTVDLCAKLKDSGHEKSIIEKTGLIIDPYFSATKIAWILDNIEGSRARAEKGDLAFGTIDTFLLWKLTKGTVHATDVTNASRTMLFNISTLQWDKDLLNIFNIPVTLLPEVKENVAFFGETKVDLLGAAYVIGGMAGDQHAAMIGQGCLKPGMIKATYGTGCFALMNAGSDFKISKHKLLTTIGYRIGNNACYALEGSIFSAGAAIQWLRDNLGLLVDAPQSEAIALSVTDSNEVYFVPAFTGLGAPYWKPNARGAIMGISRESNGAHIVRAALEAQGYQSRDLINVMEAECGNMNLTEILRIDGGLTGNAFVCQFLADMLDKTVEIPAVMESTAWGAAALAGLQCGLLTDLEEISKNWVCAHRFQPQISKNKRRTLYDGWKKAVNSVLANC